MGEKELSSVEAELYDRQIRLWGIESQEKLRAANVLLIKVQGLGSEVAKNILLSGINSLTILDDGVVTEEDLIKNFLLPPDSVGKKIAESVLHKAQALNPLVKITADTDSLEKKSEEFFAGFTIVIGTGLNTDQIVSVSDWCGYYKVKFICGEVFGMFGYTISDFQEHQYYEDRVKIPKKSRKRTHEGKISETTEPITVKVHATIQYPKLDIVLSPSKEGKRKRRNVFYYLMLILLEFRNKYKRSPLYANKEDLGNLKNLRKTILGDNNVDISKLQDGILELVFGEVVPICSIVGGVIAQEVIKAVSEKEVPINNVFLLNPLTYYGKEETIN